MPKFVRVSVIGASPVTHITITEAALRPSKHRLLKGDPLDRNGHPRPAKFGPADQPDQPDPDPAPTETSSADTTTGQEATA